MKQPAVIRRSFVAELVASNLHGNASRSSDTRGIPRSRSRLCRSIHQGAVVCLVNATNDCTHWFLSDECYPAVANCCITWRDSRCRKNVSSSFFLRRGIGKNLARFMSLSSIVNPLWIRFLPENSVFGGTLLSRRTDQRSWTTLRFEFTTCSPFQGFLAFKQRFSSVQEKEKT